MLKRSKELTIELILIVFGANLYALAMVLFFIPHKISPGGVSGLSMIAHYLFGSPVGLVGLTLNIPLFILGIYLIGKTFGVRTFVGFMTSSLFTDFYQEIVKLPSLTDDIMLATIYGSVLIGVGLGIIFRQRGTTGGSDIIAQIVYKYLQIKPGTTFLVIDGAVALLFAVIFKNIDLSLYAIVGLFISGKIINTIIEGWNYAASVFIISHQIEQITGRIIVEMGRGGTVIHGEGMYTHQDRPILYCVIAIKEISKLKHIVQEIDKDAFVIINEVHEVLGEGFRPRI